jgi:hypothetical protein
MSATPPENGAQPPNTGVSEGTDEGPAVLEDARHDAPLQAVGDGHPDSPFRVVRIEFAAHNPHITAYGVIVTPGG